MPEVLTREFHVIGPDGDVIDWLPDLASATPLASEPGSYVEEVTTYHPTRRTVFRAALNQTEAFE